MKKLNLAFSILASLGIVACSSGGSSSHTETIKQETLVPSIISGNTVTITEKGKVPETTSNSLNNTGEGITQDNTELPKTTSDTPLITEGTNPAEGNTDPSTPNTNTNTAPTPVFTEIDNSDSLFFNNELVTVTAYTRIANNENKSSINTGSYGNKLLSITQYNKLRVDNNEEIELFPLLEWNNSLDFKSEKLSKFLTRGRNTQSGLVITKDSEQPVMFLFAQGQNPTKNMPTSGLFTYTGNGQHGYYKVNTEGTDAFLLEPSLVNFTANFDDKSLKGTITPTEKYVSENDTFPEVEIGANIYNNSFSGKHNDINLYGGFYGNDASEIIGSYISDHTTINKDTVTGVFNATKQK